MIRLASLSISFAVEEEDAPNLDQLITELEFSLCDIDGVDNVAADITQEHRHYSLVVEVEGRDPDWGAAGLEAVEVIKRLVPRTLDGVRVGTPLVLDEED